MDVVDFAYQVIEMDRRIQQLEAENAELVHYKDKYRDLLDSSVQHGAAMMGNILDICMTPGVMDAIAVKNSKVDV